MTGGTVLIRGRFPHIYENAVISGGTISGKTFISGDAQVSQASGATTVVKGGPETATSEYISIHGNAEVSGGTIGLITGKTNTDVRIYGDASVSGGKILYGIIYGDAQVSGTAEIGVDSLPADGRYTYIYGNAQVSDGKVYGWQTRVYGDAQVTGGTVFDGGRVSGTADITTGETVSGDMYVKN